MSETDENILFQKTSVSKSLDKDKLKVDEEFVTLQSKIGGMLLVNFKAPEKEIERINEYFEDLTDMEPISMNIANSGNVNCYFKGISPIKELEDDVELRKFTVTLQELHE